MLDYLAMAQSWTGFPDPIPLVFSFYMGDKGEDGYLLPKEAIKPAYEEFKAGFKELFKYVRKNPKE